jgi:hypothetical protein
MNVWGYSFRFKNIYKWKGLSTKNSQIRKFLFQYYKKNIEKIATLEYNFRICNCKWKNVNNFLFSHALNLIKTEESFCSLKQEIEKKVMSGALQTFFNFLTLIFYFDKNYKRLFEMN